MYNRYIPQADGSFQRHRIQDHTMPQQKSQPAKPPAMAAPPCPVPDPSSPGHPAPRPAPRPCREPDPAPGISEFLRQLMPKGLDAGDLLVILLLLLMAGDCREEPNSALLTLMLYLFL